MENSTWIQWQAGVIYVYLNHLMCIRNIVMEHFSFINHFKPSIFKTLNFAQFFPWDLWDNVMQYRCSGPLTLLLSGLLKVENPSLGSFTEHQVSLHSMFRCRYNMLPIQLIFIPTSAIYKPDLALDTLTTVTDQHELSFALIIDVTKLVCQTLNKSNQIFF